MPKERMYRLPFDRQLGTLALVCFVGIFAGCSTTEKEGQLSPVVRAERQLARAEKIRSDPAEKVAEILSAARTAAGEISKSSGDANEESPPVKVYNRAT